METKESILGYISIYKTIINPLIKKGDKESLLEAYVQMSSIATLLEEHLKKGEMTSSAH